MKKHHNILYFFEFGLIALGFAVMLVIQMTIYYQLLLLGIILTIYIAIGLFHHNTHHDITIKVVLEYILISAIIFALFVFLNISRL
jgi:hypothetical protein